MIDRGPRIAVYARTSKGINIQGNSIKVQLDGAKSKVKLLDLPMMSDHFGIGSTPGIFIEEGWSAFTTRMAQRPAGRAVLEALHPSDVLIVYRVDRLCRSMADFCNTTAALEERGIRLVVCNPNIDMGTANGRMYAQRLAAWAEWESRRKSERIKGALAQKKLRDSNAVTGIPRERGVWLPSSYRPPERFPEEITQKPGRIFIYTRVSHRDSAQSGLGVADQHRIMDAYMDALIAANPQLVYEDAFYDEEVSARIALRGRPAGVLLNHALRPGDHVIFATVDRGFRSVRDFANTVPDWAERGIEMHFAADGLCMSDPMGKDIALAIAQFAEMESAMTSIRTREAKAIAAASGKPSNQKIPPFYKAIPVGRKKRLVLDRTKLAQYRLIRMYRLGFEGGFTSDGKPVPPRKKMTVNIALDRAERLICKRENRPPLPPTGAYRASKLGRMMPKSFKWPSDGKVFPTWTRMDFWLAGRFYDAVLAQWRDIAASRRFRRDHRN